MTEWLSYPLQRSLDMSVGIAGFGAGISQAPAAIGASKIAGVDRANARAEAAQLKEQRDLTFQRDKLKFQQEQQLAGQQTTVQEESLKMMQVQLEQQGIKLVKDSSYRATDAYLEDGDVRHFNNFFTDMKTNPYAPQEFKNIVRVDKLDPQSAQHKQLLNTLGIDDSKLDSLDGEADGQVDFDKIAKRFVIMTRPDGSQDLRDVYNFGIMSGYADYASNTQLDRLKSLATINKLNERKSSVVKPYDEPTEIQVARAVGEARNRVEQGTASSGDYALIERHEGKIGGIDIYKKAKADNSRDVLHNSDFLSVDPETIIQESSPQTRSWMDHVRTIEQSTNLSNEDKKIVVQAVKDVSAMQRAINLDPESQGFIDSPFAQVKKYFEESSAGRGAAMAYNGWVNQVRNDLFGVALSDNEIKMFNRAYGTDKQAMTSVLYGMRELASSIDGALHASALQNDPLVTHVRFGKSRQELAQAKVNLAARIKFYETVDEAKKKGASTKQAITEGVRAAGLKVNEDGTLKVAPEWNINPAQNGSRLTKPTEQPAATLPPANQPDQPGKPSLDAIFGGK